MCGIAGFAGGLVADADTTLEQMLAPIMNRGPDDHGIWHQHGVGLGHARLSVIDLSIRGHQPFITNDGLGVLAFNGEVYNFRELRQSLQQEGVIFSSDTDTEVVLYALHIWGPEQAISRFNGMFAFAYYDLRDQSLWLARDRFGIKPLFISRVADHFIFASEQKSLFAHPRLNCEPDPHSLFTLLLYERFEGAMTPYKQVDSLIPGCLYKINRGKETHSTYFDILRDIDPDQIFKNANYNLQENLSTLEERLTKSVEMHLVSDAPVATMCSGGLDSGLVTTIAKDFKPDLVSYIADIEGMHGQEVERATVIANALKLDLRCVPVGVETYFRTLPEAIVANDQPLYFSQEVASMVVAKQIRNDGFKVVLTGDGADEIFGGYYRHAHAYRHWHHARLQAKWIPDFRLMRILGKRIPNLRPINIDKETDQYFNFQRSPNDVVSAFNVLFVDGAPRSLRERRLFKKLTNLRPEERGFLAASLEDTYVHMRERLNSLDKITMHHSIEARIPFLENELVNFGLHLPVKAKYRRGVTKYVIKQLASKRLPKQIVHLPKIGFSTSPSIWRGTHEFLRGGRVADLLKWHSRDQTEILELLQTRPYYQFRLMAIEIWLRTRFDNEAPGDISDELLSYKKSAI